MSFEIRSLHCEAEISLLTSLRDRCVERDRACSSQMAMPLIAVRGDLRRTQGEASGASDRMLQVVAVVVDLAGLDYISGPGLLALAAAASRAAVEHRPFVICGLRKPFSPASSCRDCYRPWSWSLTGRVRSPGSRVVRRRLRDAETY